MLHSHGAAGLLTPDCALYLAQVSGESTAMFEIRSRRRREVRAWIPAKPSPLAALLPKVAPSTLAQYGLIAPLLLYVLKGGDILTAAQMLGRLFGGP